MFMQHGLIHWKYVHLIQWFNFHYMGRYFASCVVHVFFWYPRGQGKYDQCVKCLRIIHQMPVKLLNMGLIIPMLRHFLVFWLKVLWNIRKAYWLYLENLWGKWNMTLRAPMFCMLSWTNVVKWWNNGSIWWENWCP